MELNSTLLSIVLLAPGLSQAETLGAAFEGSWVINEETE